MEVTAPKELLVVDGHADSAESLQLLLEALGYVAHVAHDAATALELAAARPIELAFISINLSDADGYTLAGRLRAHPRPPTLIALTGYGHHEDRQRALDAGFDEHLLKPATLAQIESVLARVMRT